MVVSIEQSPGGLMSVVVFWVFWGVCVWGGGGLFSFNLADMTTAELC